MSVRRLNEPVVARVRLDDNRQPVAVAYGGRSWHRVESVLETWQVDDRWWTDAPIQRLYFTCQLDNGGAVTALYDVRAEAWYVQR